MINVIHFRSWIFWWGALTASLFVQDWLKGISDFMRSSEIFDRTKLPFSIVPGINTWIDDVAERIPASVQFNPTQEILVAGPVRLQGWVLAMLVAVIIFLLTIRYYRHALRTSAWFDDIFAILMIYLVFRIEGHIIALSRLPILEGVRAFLNNPTTAFLTLLALTLFLVFFGEGLHSKRAFWRAVAEISLVALLLFPDETAGAAGWVVERFATFGAYLKEPANVSFAVIWGIIGMLLAWQRLLNPEPGEIGGGGAKGGGGGGPPSKGGGGSGGGSGGLKLKMPWKRA